MAEGGMWRCTKTSDDNLSILVMNTDFGKKEKKDKNFYTRRNEEIEAFFKEFNPKPDFPLLHEVKITCRDKDGQSKIYDQEDAICGALGKDVYSSVKMLEWDNIFLKPTTSIRRVEFYNMIMHKTEYVAAEIVWHTRRYCTAQFTFQKKNILLISLHAIFKLGDEGANLKEDPRFSANGETLDANAIKKFLLGELLEKFHKLKGDKECDHLIIGGDFNLNMDTLLDVKKSNKKPLLKKMQEDLNKTFIDCNLMIVPYLHQRMKGKTKFDTLICDKDLADQFTVTIFFNTDIRAIKSPLPAHTNVAHFPFSENSLDHDPLLFTIKLRQEDKAMQKVTDEGDTREVADKMEGIDLNAEPIASGSGTQTQD